MRLTPAQTVRPIPVPTSPRPTEILFALPSGGTVVGVSRLRARGPDALRLRARPGHTPTNKKLNPRKRNHA